MTPGQTLATLLAIAGTSSGWLYHWANSAGTPGGKSPERLSVTRSGESVERIEERLIATQKENATLRSLLQGGGDLPVSVALQSHVEKALNLSFAESPKVTTASIGELEELALEKLEQKYSPGSLGGRAELWAALALITPGTDLAQQLAISVVETDRYVATSDKVLVSDSVAPGSHTQAAALATHLLLKYQEKNTFTSDAQLWRHLSELRQKANQVAASYQEKPTSEGDQFGIDLTPPFIQLLTDLPELAQQVSTNSLLGPIPIAALLNQSFPSEEAQAIARTYKTDSLTVTTGQLTWRIETNSEPAAQKIQQAFETAFTKNWEQTEPRPTQATERTGSNLVITVTLPTKTPPPVGSSN